MGNELRCGRCGLSLGEVSTPEQRAARIASHAEVCDPNFGKGGN